MELLKDSVCLLSKVHLFQHKKILVIFSALTHGVPGPEVLKQRRKKRERGTGTVPYQPNHVLSAFSSYVSCFKILRWSGGNGNGLNTNWKLIYEFYPPPAPRSHTNTYRFSLFFTPLLSHRTRPLRQPKHIFVIFTQLTVPGTFQVPETAGSGFSVCAPLRFPHSPPSPACSLQMSLAVL